METMGRMRQLGPSSGGTRASGCPLALTLMRNLLLLHCNTMCAEILFSHGLLQNILVRGWSIFLDRWRPRWDGSPFGPLSRRVPPSLSLPLSLSHSIPQLLVLNSLSSTDQLPLEKRQSLSIDSGGFSRDRLMTMH